MCVAALAWDAHPDWLLVVAGNRDEFHERPAAALSAWPDGSGILAGSDLMGGGTWLGLTEAGRFGLVTNFRVPAGPQPGRPSRGRLVTDLLIDTAPQDMAAMNAFNLILVEHGPAAYAASFLTNYPAIERRWLEPGIHGLSNGGFDVPWPKTLQVQRAIEQWLGIKDGDPASLLEALRDETPLPGDGPEQRFSPVFIADPAYGTRCSTVVAIARSGQGIIVEHSFDSRGGQIGEIALNFVWPPAA